MHGLLLRLSATDAEAEAAVRVIAAFDELVARRADIAGLLRSAAGLSGCKAGISDPGRDLQLCFGPDGRAVNGPSGAPSAHSTRSRLGDEGVAQVWLDRMAGPGHLDEIIAERLAVAAALVLERMFGNSLYLADPAAVELLLSEGAPEVDRARSARLLGLSQPSPVRAIAIARDAAAARAGARPVDDLAAALRANGGVAHFARIGPVLAVLTTAVALPSPLPEGFRAGLGAPGPILGAPASWAGARAALRFTASLGMLKRPAVADVARLGSLLALASVPPEDLGALPDVLEIARLAAGPSGHEHIKTLDAFCRTGSLRRAAEELYLHHTSVAARVAHIGHALGYTLGSADAVFRATLALNLWQLANSPE